MKRIFPIILFLMFLVAIPFVSAETVIELDPSTENVNAGDSFDVEILVTPDSIIDTVATDLITWNPENIHCKGISVGNLFDNQTIWIKGTIDNENGQIRNMIWGSNEPTDDKGIFCTMSFLALKGDTTIEISEDESGVARKGTEKEKTISNECTVAVSGEHIPIKPTASFISNINRLSVEVNAGTSEDDGNIQNYSWDWENDGVFDAYGKEQNHTYEENGTYEITLKVTDDEGFTTTKTSAVTVNTEIVNPAGNNEDDGFLTIAGILIIIAVVVFFAIILFVRNRNNVKTEDDDFNRL